MNAKRTALATAIVLLILAPVVFAQATLPPPKLYRWVGADGKTHYSDDLPPEAMTQARDELSKNSGITLNQVARAQTPEEIAAAKAKAEADEKAAEALAKAKQSDEMLLTSYPTEGDLKRAYADRLAQVAESLKSTRFGLDNQQQSLASLLNAASILELTGKPVPMTMVASIKSTHGQIVEQQQYETSEEARTAGIRQEGESALAHYRALRSGSASGRSDGPPASPPAASSSPGG